MQLRAPPGGSPYFISTSPVADNPITTAVWTLPAPLAQHHPHWLPLVSSTAVAACSPVIFNMNVLITTTDATNPISEQGIAYANNSLAVQITDQSVIVLTSLLQTGSVLNGPQGQPGAVGPTDTNDDYTNKSVNTGIAGVAPGGVTTAAGTVSFTNTVQNSGNANDNFHATSDRSLWCHRVVVNGVPSSPTVQLPVLLSLPGPSPFGASANYTVP